MKRFNKVYLVIAAVVLCVVLFIGIKASSSAMKENPKDETVSAISYDTAEFENVTRNKGDMSKKQGVYYEIFVRSFADSNGDGIGDLKGVTQKLDYLKDLGIDGIWLMPITSSPSYHGYDVTDYYSINSAYGTEEDFKNLLSEAHKKNIKVIMDFVINHTSNQHPWFKEALSNPDSKYRNYYRWVSDDDTENYSKDDKSPWGSEVWHPGFDAEYYGIFSAEMPDLNYNNEEVRTEIKSAAKKWLDLGIDGFRLDAAIHIYGDNEFKKQKSNLDSNIQWWNEFASYCETINPDVYLVGETWNDLNTLPEYVQPFDTKFNFAVEQNILNAVSKNKSETKDKKDLSKMINDVYEKYDSIDTKYLDGVFGSNHDMDRIMSQVKTDEKARLVANIYMTLKGNPYIYYGEELGMKGRGSDPQKRTPFIWSTSDNSMNTSWEPDMMNKKTNPLDAQINDNNSMYNFYKNLISVRKNNPELITGKYKNIELDNKSILGYVRELDGKKVYVFHNLSDKPVSFNSPYDVNNIIYAYGDNTSGSGKSINIGKDGTIIFK
ncbi:alpha-amylase family glycosyl hydrolase [Clostridium sp. BJN0001]|uniref:alpha-amylase family glycosyl hydrolase n=1 Tax=Clostridium sp. BJN0001 TaxID=2930219 RepID=UPI001FD11478|nr:alpha-amylase family glycosyl hydrolase [Clostridium sp. BJN0001]